MNYQIEFSSQGPGSYMSANVEGLKDGYLHFTHHDFDIVWNPKTRDQETIHGVNKFFGGNVGEGSSFTTWQDAIHSSLYDLYQYNEELHDGDTFAAEYLGEKAKFACEGVHVVRRDK